MQSLRLKTFSVMIDLIQSKCTIGIDADLVGNASHGIVVCLHFLCKIQLKNVFLK